MPLPWLKPDKIVFPPIELALKNPNGLLAAGGALSKDWLMSAYRHGAFPWYESGQPILWWSPDPRLVLTPESLKISRSLRKLLRKNRYNISFDTCFSEVINHCSEARRDGGGTWITNDIKEAYIMLHEEGYAHSVEVFYNGDLVGGLYGVGLGKVFFGESMFSKEDNASKIALVYLIRHIAYWGFKLIDCQVSSKHLFSLGAIEISRTEFCGRLKNLLQSKDKIGKWRFDANLT
tara:strand:- start:203 stop:904 length:702 start_codon:yes stop_codon:yes gene_type:complete